MNYREGIRNTLVSDVRVTPMKREDKLFPKEMFEGEPLPEEIWWVWITSQTGLLPVETWPLICKSQTEVARALESFEIGLVFSHDEAGRDDVGWRETIRKSLNAQRAPSTGNTGPDSPLALEVLANAGITDGFGPLSREVLEWLGANRIEELKTRFGENWKVAGAFEFCWATLPPSSPAYLAALYQFHYYITEDDFAAGYYWRDLEVVVLGVEATAAQARDMRANAGRAGSLKSAQARLQRRETLLQAMEAIAVRNPDVPMLGEAALIKLAVAECKKNHAALWSQGQGQADEYLGEIRRGEAGHEMRARYNRLFKRKAP